MKYWIKENWFRFGILVTGLIIAYSFYQILVVQPHIKREEAKAIEFKKEIEEENRRIEAQQLVIEKARARANDPKSDSFIVTYDKSGHPLTWTDLDRVAIIFNDTLNTYTTSLLTIQKVQDDERQLLGRIYGTLANTSIPEYRYQLQVMINYDEDYIASGEKFISFLTDSVKNYRGLLNVIGKREPQLYFYYSEEINKLDLRKKGIIDDYVSKQNAKQNYAKSVMLSL